MKPQRSVVLIPVLYLVALVVVNIIGVIIYGLLTYEDETMRLIRMGSIVNLLFYGSLFVLYIVLFIPAWKRTFAYFTRHITNQAAYIVIGLISMFVMMLGMGLLYSVLGVVETPENQAILEMQLTGPLFDRIGLAVFAIFLAPFVEEVVFRLASFRLLKRIKGIPLWAVILLSSLLFGLIHVMGDDLVQILYYAGLGIVLGVIYHKSNNILPPIIIHMIFNTFVTISMFVGF